MTSFIKVTTINHIQVWNARHGLSSLISLLLKRDSYPLFLGVVRSYYLKNRTHTVLWSGKQTGQVNFKGEVLSFLPFPFRNSEPVFRGMYHTLLSNAFNSKTDVNTSAQQNRLCM